MTGGSQDTCIHTQKKLFTIIYLPMSNLLCSSLSFVLVITIQIHYMPNFNSKATQCLWNLSEKSTTIHGNKTVLKCIKFLYSLSFECNVFQTSCGICKGQVHDLIVRRVKYEYVYNFIAIDVYVYCGRRGGFGPLRIGRKG